MNTETAHGGRRPLDQTNRLEPQARLYRQPVNRIPQIIGGIQKIGQSLETPTLAFSAKFLMGFCSDGPCECRPPANLKFVALPIPGIIGGTMVPFE